MILPLWLQCYKTMSENYCTHFCIIIIIIIIKDIDIFCATETWPTDLIYDIYRHNIDMCSPCS